MTLTENLQRLITAKDDIKHAIIEKGVPVLDSETIDTYAEKITDIDNYSSTFVANLISVTADGDENTSTTKLTLTFDVDVVGLRAKDIILGSDTIEKGNLIDNNDGTFELELLSGVSNGDLLVEVEARGYIIHNNTKIVVTYSQDFHVQCLEVIASGDYKNTTSTIYFKFNKPIPLAVNDITITTNTSDTIAKKSVIKHNSNTYALSISGFSMSQQIEIEINRVGYTVDNNIQLVYIYYAIPLKLLTFSSVSYSSKKIYLNFDKEIELTMENIFFDIYPGYEDFIITIDNLTKVSTTQWSLDVLSINKSGYTYITIDISGYETINSQRNIYISSSTVVVKAEKIGAVDVIPLIGIKLRQHRSGGSWTFSASYFRLTDNNGTNLSFTGTNLGWVTKEDGEYYEIELTIISDISNSTSITFELTASYPGNNSNYFINQTSWTFDDIQVDPSLLLTPEDVELINIEGIDPSRFIYNFTQLKTILEAGNNDVDPIDYYIVNNIYVTATIIMQANKVNINLHPYHKDITFYSNSINNYFYMYNINSMLSLGVIEDTFKFIINGAAKPFYIQNQTGTLNINDLLITNCVITRNIIEIMNNVYSTITRLVIENCTINSSAFLIYHINANYKVTIYSLIITNNIINVANLFYLSGSNNTGKLILKNDIIVKDNTYTQEMPYCTFGYVSPIKTLILDGPYIFIEILVLVYFWGETTSIESSPIVYNQELVEGSYINLYITDSIAASLMGLNLLNMTGNYDTSFFHYVDSLNAGFYINSLGFLANDNPELNPTIPEVLKYEALVDYCNNVPNNTEETIVLNGLYIITKKLRISNKAINFVSDPDDPAVFKYRYMYNYDFVNLYFGKVTFDNITIDGYGDNSKNVRLFDFQHDCFCNINNCTLKNFSFTTIGNLQFGTFFRITNSTFDNFKNNFLFSGYTSKVILKNIINNSNVLLLINSSGEPADSDIENCDNVSFQNILSKCKNVTTTIPSYAYLYKGLFEDFILNYTNLYIYPTATFKNTQLIGSNNCYLYGYIDFNNVIDLNKVRQQAAFFIDEKTPPLERDISIIPQNYTIGNKIIFFDESKATFDKSSFIQHIKIDNTAYSLSNDGRLQQSPSDLTSIPPINEVHVTTWNNLVALMDQSTSRYKHIIAYLDNDVTVNSQLTVSNNMLIIDGQGHTITTNYSNGFSLGLSYSRVILKNCTITADRTVSRTVQITGDYSKIKIEDCTFENITSSYGLYFYGINTEYKNCIFKNLNITSGVFFEGRLDREQFSIFDTCSFIDITMSNNSSINSVKNIEFINCSGISYFFRYKQYLYNIKIVGSELSTLECGTSYRSGHLYLKETTVSSGFVLIQNSYGLCFIDFDLTLIYDDFNNCPNIFFYWYDNLRFAKNEIVIKNMTEDMYNKINIVTGSNVINPNWSISPEGRLINQAKLPWPSE